MCGVCVCVTVSVCVWGCSGGTEGENEVCQGTSGLAPQSPLRLWKLNSSRTRRCLLCPVPKPPVGFLGGRSWAGRLGACGDRDAPGSLRLPLRGVRGKERVSPRGTGNWRKPGFCTAKGEASSRPGPSWCASIAVRPQPLRSRGAAAPLTAQKASGRSWEKQVQKFVFAEEPGPR